MDPAGGPVLVLWKDLHDYVLACLGAVAALGHDVKLVGTGLDPLTPYRLRPPDGVEVLPFVRRDDVNAVGRLLGRLRPALVLTCGWDVPAYVRALHRWDVRRPSVLYMDNQWERSLRQRAGVVASPWLLHRAFDGVCYPGDPQAAFADRLGFPRRRHLAGGISCNRSLFRPPAADAPRAHEFLFVGRLVHDKGVDVLADAYRRYRAEAQVAGRTPWKLRVCGEGPLAEALEGPGVHREGFVEPAQLAVRMRDASAAVLPSRWEPWCVALHEAVSSGLPVVTTRRVGAASHLVVDRLNGRIVEEGDGAALAEAMTWVAERCRQAAGDLAHHSIRLAASFTPERFAAGIDEALGWEVGRRGRTRDR